MARKRLTRREVRDRFHVILAVGACALDSLLEDDDLIGYLDRVEGWAADVYYAGYVNHKSVGICTGYATIGSKPDYELVKEYANLGRQINDAIDVWTPDYVEKRVALRRYLLNEFLEEVVR